MSRKIQIATLITLILVLAVVSINIILNHPLAEFTLVRPFGGFIISAIIGSIFKEFKRQNKLPKFKGIKLIYPKIKKKKP